jgi:hypothetical protein
MSVTPPHLQMLPMTQEGRLLISEFINLKFNSDMDCKTKVFKVTVEPRK